MKYNFDYQNSKPHHYLISRLRYADVTIMLI